MKDVLNGLRTLWRNPSFSLIATLSLALSIGANTTVFSVLDSVLLKPLPYPESDRLVVVRTIQDDGRNQIRTSSIAMYFAIRDEIALRMIVGAGAPHVVWMVMADVMKFVGIGLLVGVGLALAASRLLQSALFRVTPTDLLTYATVSALFLVVAVIACLLPTWRAITISPTTALRAE